MARRNRALLDILTGQKACLHVPGCWDGLSARLIAQAGFEVAFLSGGAHAMARFGLPDMGFVSLSQLEETTLAICDTTDLALIVDADTGFGNALNTAQTVRLLERAGACAIQLEDQVAPKRCGHMAGKSVIAPHLAAGKIMAAVDSRASEKTCIIARTDAASIEGINAALDRAELYLEAGADLIFVEGPSTIADMAAIQARFAGRAPLVHNMVGGGTNPITKPSQLTDLGYQIALHPLVLLAHFAKTAPTVLGGLGQSLAASDELADLNTRVGTQSFLTAALAFG